MTRSSSLFFAAVLATATAVAPALQAAGPPHLDQAQHLIDALLSDPLDTNVYGTPGHIDWTGDPRKAIYECSTFATMLLKHTYGYTDANFALRTGNVSPTAAIYHDDMIEGRSFTRISTPASLIPGDYIAVRYPAGEESTGHMMMAQAVGAWQPRSASKQTFLAGSAYPEIAGFYDITIIDSSASFHGPSDSRASHPGGIGRNGIARIYVNVDHVPTGYTWSTEKSSAYESPATNGRSLAMGRWIE
jgi:hypothetical protein